MPKNGGSTRQKSGAAKMRQSGKRGILLAVTQEQYDIIRAASLAEVRAMSSYLIWHGLCAAGRQDAVREQRRPVVSAPRTGRETDARA